ncbi:MAG: site-specific DNA-methyltransferase [Propionibacteriaceae bacterium]|jgi:hypothetical protein|nr:site-specific DNA-methyltransferase [Propionibacteriaceae bacterium]
MTDYLLLLAPAANRVYAQATPVLAAAELELTGGFEAICPTEVAGVSYVGFSAATLGSDELAIVAKQSAALALFARLPAAPSALTPSLEAAFCEPRPPVGSAATAEAGKNERGQDVKEALHPIALPPAFVMDDDLVSIPKYHGKTNEQFTRLLLNVTLAACRTGAARPEVLDPLAGRGTTLTTAWLYGLDAAGVEVDDKAFEAMAAYLKTYLRTKRFKHTAAITPVRRDGRALGRRFDATLKDAPNLKLSVFTGDTRDSAKLYGKRRFDCIVTDAPYGVSHGARNDVGGSGAAGRRPAPVPRTRSPEKLLAEAIPVWASQLKPGGALGIAYNTFTQPREQLLDGCRAAGLEPMTGGAWERLAHRVDQAILRDVVVAVQAGREQQAEEVV